MLHNATSVSNSSAQIQALCVILSYLRLLVNSRDELALAQAINTPDRGLGHRPFTVLRKVARQKRMPMFQVRQVENYFSKQLSGSV